MSPASPGPVLVPDIGDFDGVPVIEILVSVGDTVSAEDPLLTLESDKATMDVPAPYDGVVRAITVSVGDTVAQGSPLMEVEPAGGSSETPAPASAAESAPTTAQPPAETIQTAPPTPGEVAAERAPVEARRGDATGNGGSAAGNGASAAGNGSGPIDASPSVRRLAREMGVELRGASGSGRRGRLTADDVRTLAQGGGAAVPTAQGAGADAGPGTGVAGLELLPWPTVDFERFGPVERVERTRIQRISAPNLARNWVMIPHVTHHDEADITDLEAWRQELNAEYRGEVKFTMVAFLVKACVAALQAFPDVNSSLDGETLVRKRYWNVGFAADTPNGLVVPVIKAAERKGLAEIATELTELSGRAREGKLSREDMSGATFTISSLGGIGGTGFTPIINAPEVAILGVTRAALKPVWDGSAFAPRLMVPLSFSYDHRVVDGAAAARFVALLARVLADLRRSLL